MIECKNKVSVIMSTYNHKDYIARSLNSILMQKTDFAFTIWIADDCSTDGTSEIIQGIIKHNHNSKARIEHVIAEHNLGVKNKVIHFDNILTSEDLKNQYVAGIGGDDYWINDRKLQQQYDILRKNPDSISVCDSFVWWKPDGMFIYQHQNKIIEKNKAVVEPKDPFSQGSSIMFKNIIDWKYFPDLLHDDGGFIKVFNFYGDNIFREITTSVYYSTVQGLGTSTTHAHKQSQNNLNYLMYLIIRIIHYLKTNENLLVEKDHNYIMTNLTADWQYDDMYGMDNKILSFVEQYKKKRKYEGIAHYAGMSFEPTPQYKIVL